MFVEELIDNLSSKNLNISKVNPKITKFSDKLTALHNEYTETKDKNVLKEIKQLRLSRNTLSSRIRTGNRIRYIRYADDWVIGIIGNKEFADRIKAECKKFLSDYLKIQLNEEKTRITHLGTERAKFLGVEFDIPPHPPATLPTGGRESKEAKIVKRRINDRKIKSRINQAIPYGGRERIYFYLPVQEMIKTFLDKGFLKKSPNGLYLTNAITKWIFLDHRSIILRYNAVIRGLLNYYSFVDNKYCFHTLINLFLVHSCAKTIARKFRLGSRAGAFKKFGFHLKSPLEGKLKGISLHIPKDYKKTSANLRKTVTLQYNPFEVLN
jgi:Type II intron maturase/Reverse transcriptase (RNA-dependent DNA polymerase)